MGRPRAAGSLGRGGKQHGTRRCIHAFFVFSPPPPRQAGSKVSACLTPGWLFSMSGVGAAMLEPQEPAQHESVRVYLSQSVLPTITEALTAMEKERCPNPVPHAFAALLSLTSTCAAQSRTTSYLACEQARGAS